MKVGSFISFRMTECCRALQEAKRVDPGERGIIEFLKLTRVYKEGMYGAQVRRYCI